MTIVGLGVLPATVTLLPDATVDPDHRQSVTAKIVARLPDVPTVVLLASGPEAMLPDGHRTTVRIPGEPDVAREVSIDRELLRAVATRTSTPRLRSDHLEGPAAVLASTIAALRDDVAFLPLHVASGAVGAGLGAVASGLVRAIAGTDREVAVVADGVLGSAPGVDDPWADALVAAVLAGDGDAAAALGPSDAADRGASGWAPLTVLAHVARAAGLSLGAHHLLRVDGTTQLLAG